MRGLEMSTAVSHRLRTLCRYWPSDGAVRMDPKQTKHLEISCVVATIERPEALSRALRSLEAQEVLPAELILVDASRCDASRRIANTFVASFAARGCVLRWVSAVATGAAAQRNQGVALATQPFIAFFDDDIVFEKECLAPLLTALLSDPQMGGVNAMITNQRYCLPGLVTRCLFWLLAEERKPSYGGRVFGPAINILPEDRDDLPEVVPVDWLNLGCTLYRREALPNPPFPSNFIGYSMMEDLALSLVVGQRWKLANARTAHIYHDSQPGPHKDDAVALSRMELINRYFVMTEILGRRTVGDVARLAVWEAFQLIAFAVRKRLRRPFWRMLRGKWLGALEIRRTRKSREMP